MTNQEFIEKIAAYVKKYAPQYGIKCNSAIIAQAILESGWGKSKLAATYHNYFGLKCGTKWTGKSVNLTTQEEYETGSLTTIKDNFRVYDSMEEGVKGYFEFIQLSRYQNLKGITDPRTYLETIKADGYATSSTYVENNMALVNQYNLTRFDNNAAGVEGGINVGVTAQDVLNVMRSWLGFSEANGKFKQIIDLYNSHKPLARGYAVKYTDEWCDTTVSAAAIKAGAVDLIGTECGCEEHVKIFKQKGIWIEDGTITPKPGDIVLYNWDDNTQPNDGYSDHIGYVESVSGNTITTIEGNKGEAVARRTLNIGNGNIRGYARPKYASGNGSTTTPSTSYKKPVSEIADEVIAGKWGNGDERKNALTAAGYNYSEVQAAVNAKVSGGNSTSAKKSNVEIAKEVIAGKWGNGNDRKEKLEAAGYDYDAIQVEVNKQLKGSISTGSSGSSLKPSYTVGNTYALQVDAVRVRTGAGTNNAAKNYSQLTANARQNAYSNGCLKKGTAVTCQAVKNVGSDIWIKIPSGWIAAYYNGKKYVE